MGKVEEHLGMASLASSCIQKNVFDSVSLAMMVLRAATIKIASFFTHYYAVTLFDTENVLMQIAIHCICMGLTEMNPVKSIFQTES